MTLTVRQFPCLSDNYGFLIRDDATGKTACIDTPDAAAILRELKAAGWGLDFIFNTHWHPDHAGGNAEIQKATGCTIVGPAEVTRIAPLDREVHGGDTVELGETSVPGDRDRRPHARPHRLLRRRRPGRLRRRHPVRARLRAAVRGQAGADVGLALAARGAAGRHEGLLRPRIHRLQRPLRAQRRSRPGAEGPRRRRCSPPASAASGPCRPPSGWRRPPTPSCARRCWPIGSARPARRTTRPSPPSAPPRTPSRAEAPRRACLA